MLLALGCGVAIMLAGAVFLFQLTHQDELAEPISIGEPTMVGDMSVVVDTWQEGGVDLFVSVRIGGVEDLDGGSGFRLIASGRPLAPDLTDVDGVCGATTIEEQSCVVHFDVSTADGDSRVLFYERGEDRARWVLG